MTWSFGESFDLYAAVADGANGYWDTSSGWSIVAGRFTGSRAAQFINTSAFLSKSSAVNDPVHHFVVSFLQTAAVSTTQQANLAIELFDGATAQCSVVFSQNGSILLTSGAPTGTVLDIYPGAFITNNVWYAFEFEVAVNNTTGSWAVRKNGNNVNDHALGSLNTRGGTANNYANKVTLIQGTNFSAQQFDDFFWQSGASTGTWLGDLRSYTRMPASDQSVQFTALSPYSTTPYNFFNTGAITAGVARYTSFTLAVNGTLGTASVSMGAGYTGNLKCSIFSDNAGNPGTVLGSANVIVNPATGANAITFGTPVALSQNTTYWIGFDSDTTSGSFNQNNVSNAKHNTQSYASFPVSNPTGLAVDNNVIITLNITLIDNYSSVNEAQQNGLVTYVYDSTVGQADLYGIAATGLAITTVAVITRGYMEKSDAGTRTAAVQLKSGGTTVASPTLTLANSGFQWAWRNDVVDPNTSAAWASAAVDALQIGPKVIA